jgi:plastocyanin
MERLTYPTFLKSSVLGVLASSPVVHNITNQGSTFTPNYIEVMKGDTIIWTRSGGNHTVTSGSSYVADGLFDAPLDAIDPIFEWVVPNNVPSSIPYFCDPHCTFGMTADIVVLD